MTYDGTLGVVVGGQLSPVFPLLTILYDREAQKSVDNQDMKSR